MSARRVRIKPFRRSFSLSTTLWVVFTVLLLVVVGILGIGQSAILNRAYEDQAKNDLFYECKEVYDEISVTEEPPPSALERYLMLHIFDSGKVICLMDSEGNVKYPTILSNIQPEEYSSIDYVNLAEKIGNNLKDSSYGQFVGFRYGAHCCVAGTIRLYGENMYLCGLSPIGVSKAINAAMIMQIVFVSLIVLILSFILIGVISSKISEPIASISEKAKKMGNGNFDVDFSADVNSCTEITELSKTLNYTRDELSKADQMQKELIANVTHDFKTPLTMIKAYASMIQEISGDIPEKRNKHCQVIIDESDRLAALVNDMLDISKLRSGINTLKTSVFNLSEYTEAIVDRFGYLSETKGYTIETDIAKDLYTEADKDKIGQVIYNLIGNAVNYTGEDKKITVRLVSSGGFIRFDVTDTGSGIKKEEIDTIWDRYYRSSEMHKRPVKGTGLGLSIVKTVLTKHNFNFGVLSEVGKGSTFYVDFPLRTVWSFEDKGHDIQNS